MATANSISKLKQLWQKEKEHYRKAEVGTGVQSFIKKVLESDDVFKLKEGRLSTKLTQRRNEFIHEKKAKQQRKADFYIYISPDIAIPVEAECYGNLQVGEPQLFNYQKDFEKQYGILTDGFTWRFYNNNLYRTFSLDDILGKTALFLTFWKEYIKPEGYYLAFFEKVGQLALTEEKTLRVEDCRESFFEDITKLIQNFKNKLRIEGYLKDTEDKSKEQRAIELTYAYIIQFILYKTLVDNEFDEFSQEFESLVDTIHKNLKEKGYKNILGIINGISDGISKNIYRPFSKEQEFINKKIFELLRSLKNTLNDVSPWLDILVFIKKYNFANVRNEIFGFIYENYLKELYAEGQKGQYFTDPAVVNFMLEQIGYTPKWVKKRYESDKDSISLIDPACGSGTFLYAATDIIVRALKDGYTEEASKKIEEVITSSIFGLDIEEFPLYLAEMSILMRLLPLIIHQKYNNPIDKKIKVFKTRDSISEFMDTALRNTPSDMKVELEKSGGQMTLFTQKLNLGYSSYVRDEDDLKEMKKSLENLPDIPRRRFDFVIGNPPYVSYKMCSKQKVLVHTLIKQRKIKMSDIYGVNLHSIPDNPKRYAPNPNLYAFFIALGVALLKDSGQLCYIVPQTMLFAGDLDVIRYHLAKFTTIKKIITFSGKMFIGRGLKQNKPVYTSSLVFIIEKKAPLSLNNVEIVNCTDSDSEVEETLENVSKEKKIKRVTVLQSDLLRNVSNWCYIKHGKSFLDFHRNYKNNTDDISRYYEHVLAQREFGTKFYFDRGVKYPKNKVKKPKDLEKDDYYFIPLVNKDKYYLSGGQEGIHRSLLDFPFGSQGERVYLKKYKILWRYINYDRFRFSRERLVIDYNNVLISSDNRNELLYLLSILNSSVSSRILNALFRSENEKDILIGIKTIKGFIRTPRITKENQHTKNKVIKLTNKLLDLERVTLEDLVDFSGVMAQKFDSASLENNQFVLKRGEKKNRLPIKKNGGIIKKIIESESGELKLGLEDKEISLSELKSTPAVDPDRQKTIKDHVDDLVFALYFNVEIPKNKLSDPRKVKELCKKNKHYALVL